MAALAITAFLIWMVLLFARGSFWRITPDLLRQAGSRADSRSARDGCDPILAIVPARNEAGIIAATLPTLLAQARNVPLHVILVDDHSDDGTADVARAAADACGHADRLTVVAADSLPSGWTGKLSAMQSGLDHARRAGLARDRILFTDADIAYGPGTLARLVEESDARGVVLASLMVKLRAVSAAERWLVPAFVYFFRMLYPFAFVNDPARRTAAAAGGVMLVECEALERAGGLSAIAGSLIDDCALGALMKRQGPVWLGLADDVVSVRPSPVFADIRRMVVRSAYAELRHSPFRLCVAILGLTLVFVVPPAAALFGEGAARLFGVAGWAAMTVSFAPMLRLYAIPVWHAVLLPAIAAIYGFFTLESAFAHRRGRGGLWKGRVHAAGPAAAMPKVRM